MGGIIGGTHTIRKLGQRVAARIVSIENAEVTSNRIRNIACTWLSFYSPVSSDRDEEKDGPIPVLSTTARGATGSACPTNHGEIMLFLIA